MTKIPRFAEKGFVVFSLLTSVNALSFLHTRKAGEVGREADPLIQAIFVGVYAVTILLLFALRKKAVRVVARDKLLWVMVGIALFSALWSTLPEVTLRRGLALVGTTLFGIYLAMRYSLEEQLRLLGWTFGIVAILSLVVAIGMPSYGIEPSGAWRGIYGQKNILAAFMALGAMVFLLLALSGHRHRWIAWAMFGLCAGLTVLSTSKAGLVNLITVLILFIFYRPLRLHYNLAIPLSIFSILAIGGAANLLWSNSEILLKSLGKDATFTGRTPLWEAVFEMIWKRPILGYGYSGFWTNGWYGPAAEVWQIVGWQPGHAHNGLLDLWLDTGLLGVSVFVLGYLINVMRAVSWIRLTKTAEGFWPLIFMTYIFLYNQVELSLLGQNSIFWILYTALSFSRPIENVQARKTYRHKTKGLVGLFRQAD